MFGLVLVGVCFMGVDVLGFGLGGLGGFCVFVGGCITGVAIFGVGLYIYVFVRLFVCYGCYVLFIFWGLWVCWWFCFGLFGIECLFVGLMSYVFDLLTFVVAFGWELVGF